MSGVNGISQQHDILMVPVAGLERGKVNPLRVIREQLRPIQITGQQLLAKGKALCFIGLVKPRAQPGCFVAFNDEGAGGAAERISMHLEKTLFVLAKDKGEGIEDFVCAEPDIPCLAQLDARLENGFVCFAHDTVNAIGGNQQVIAAEFGEISNLATKREADTEFSAAPLQDVQQQLARDTGNHMTAATDCFTAITGIDIVPDHEMIANMRIG